jgi:hypothetical protein
VAMCNLRYDIIYSKNLGVEGLFQASCLGALDVAGVGGTLGLSRLRFQKPALGPLIMKANVHRDKPRKVSGW